MLLIWGRIHAWVFVFAVLGVSGEIGQWTGLVPGTFDWNDIVFHVVGFILACKGHEYAKARSIDNRTVGYGRACSG